MRVNPANLLCVARVALGLLAVGVLLGFDDAVRYLVVAVIIILSVVTDIFDGKIARRFGFESEVGRLSDRYADHISANTFWVMLAAAGFVSMWVPVIMITRDTVFYWVKDAQGVSGIAGVTRLNWLSSARFMRALYSILKLVSWCGILVIAYLSIDFNIQPIVWATVAMGLIRVVPVLTAGWQSVVLVKK